MDLLVLRNAASETIESDRLEIFIRPPVGSPVDKQKRRGRSSLCWSNPRLQLAEQNLLLAKTPHGIPPRDHQIEKRNQP